MTERHWSVEVRVDGNRVLTIESNFLSGVDNVDEFAEEIRIAAESLLGFIGTKDPSPFIVPDDGNDFIETDAEALSVLCGNFTWDRGVIRPIGNHKRTPEEGRAVAILCNEWDYIYLDGSADSDAMPLF